MKEVKLYVIVKKHMDTMRDEICDEFEKALGTELHLREIDKK